MLNKAEFMKSIGMDDNPDQYNYYLVHMRDRSEPMVIEKDTKESLQRDMILDGFFGPNFSEGAYINDGRYDTTITFTDQGDHISVKIDYINDYLWAKFVGHRK